MAGRDLDNAKRTKVDEFYTQLADIERELNNYKNHFRGKTIFCNCDDPETSNFYYFFVSYFEELGLKKLITTHFEFDKPSYKLEYEGGADTIGDKETVIKRAIKTGKKIKLKQNFQQGEQDDLFVKEPARSFSGDFRSPECIELLKESDIVVTNPPFSLFRQYVVLLMEYKKKFLIIGNVNAISYKEVFSYIMENKLWTGVSTFNQGLFFEVPEHLPCQKIENGKRLVRVASVCWFTNLDHKRHHSEFIPKKYKKYKGNEQDYPKYDNYDAINIDNINEIPIDYNKLMGVPITFIDKYNPDQFEILGITDRQNTSGLRTKKYTEDDTPKYNDLNARSVIIVNGEYKPLYARLLIKKKRGEN
jgi:hypothetical protein